VRPSEGDPALLFSEIGSLFSCSRPRYGAVCCLLFRPRGGFLAPLSRGLLRYLSLLLRGRRSDLPRIYRGYLVLSAPNILVALPISPRLFPLPSGGRKSALQSNRARVALPPARMEEPHKGPSVFAKNFATFGAGASSAGTVAISPNFVLL